MSAPAPSRVWPLRCRAGHPFVPGSYTLQANGDGGTYRRCCRCHAAAARAWRAAQIEARGVAFYDAENQRRRSKRQEASTGGT